MKSTTMGVSIGCTCAETGWRAPRRHGDGSGRCAKGSPWRLPSFGGVLLVALFATPLAGQPAAAGEPPVLTLEAAVQASLRDNRLIANASLDVGRAADETEIVRSQRLPNVSIGTLGLQLLAPLTFTFQQGLFGTYPGIGPVPSQDTPVSTQRFVLVGEALLTEPVTQQFKIGLGVRAREVSEEIAREQLREARQSIAGEVRTTYYALLGTQSALTAAREAVAAAREIERVLGERVQAGAVLEADLLQARARRVRAEYDQLAAENALSARKERMNLLLGRPLATDFRLASVPGPDLSPEGLEAARRRALEDQPRLRTARLQMSQAEYDLKLQKAQWIPDLSFAMLYARTANFDPFVPKEFFGLGFLLNWEIFDGGRRSRLAAIKEKTLEEAANAVAQTEESTLIEVGRIYRQMEEAMRFIDAAEIGRAAARERLRIVTDRFASGSASAAELLEAQARQADADRQQQEAVAAFWAARGAYDLAIGREP